LSEAPGRRIAVKLAIPLLLRSSNGSAHTSPQHGISTRFRARFELNNTEQASNLSTGMAGRVRNASGAAIWHQKANLHKADTS
jgi:hypothetical protein